MTQAVAPDLRHLTRPLWRRFYADAHSRAAAFGVDDGDAREAAAMGLPEGVGGEALGEKRRAVDEPGEGAVAAFCLERDARSVAHIDHRTVRREENLWRRDRLRYRERLATEMAKRRRQGGAVLGLRDRNGRHSALRRQEIEQLQHDRCSGVAA